MNNLNKLVKDSVNYFKLVNRSSRFYYKLALSIGICSLGITFMTNYYLKRKRQLKLTSKTSKIIDMIPELKHSNVRIKNIESVERILSNVIRNGKDRLQIICDFDRTLTKYEYKGIKSATSFSVLENCNLVTPELRTKFQNLRDVYLPIEHDLNLTRDEKIPYMVEWWKKWEELIVSSNSIFKHDIEDVVKNSNTQLRDGTDWLFHTLERLDVPVLIFSAGIGNVVDEFIKQQCGQYKNVKIISNFMKFNSTTNKLVSFDQGKIIHIFNKNERVLLDTEYEKQIENRSNVIIIGDSPGDTNMHEGFPHINSVLKIGFLNDNFDQLLPVYENLFDIVIINDQTFNVPNAILRSII